MIFMICSVAIFATKYKKRCGRLVYRKRNRRSGDRSSDGKRCETGRRTGEEYRRKNNRGRKNRRTGEINDRRTDGNNNRGTDNGSINHRSANNGGSSNYRRKQRYGLYQCGESGYVVKGDDWYNKRTFLPANVTDDTYFDTAVVIGDSRTEGLSLYTGMSNLDAFFSKRFEY